MFFNFITHIFYSINKNGSFASRKTLSWLKGVISELENASLACCKDPICLEGGMSFIVQSVSGGQRSSPIKKGNYSIVFLKYLYASVFR